MKNSLLNYLFLSGIHSSLGPEVFRTLQFLNASDSWDGQSLETLQTKKLTSLLRRARQSTRFYSTDEYSHGHREHMGDPRDLMEHLPVLTKEIVRNECANMRPENISPIFSSRTGGTTGAPLEIKKCSQGVAWAIAALWRGRSVGGIGPVDKGIYAKGVAKPSWKGRMRMRLLRKHLVQGFNAGIGQRNRFSKLLSTGKIRFVEGYVTGLLDLSSEIGETPNGLKAVFTTGEMLYPQQRKLLSDRFNAPVYSYYGSNEIGGIAFECEQGEKHVTDEHILLETLDDNGQLVWVLPQTHGSRVRIPSSPNSYRIKGMA